MKAYELATIEWLCVGVVCCRVSVLGINVDNVADNTIIIVWNVPAGR